MRNYSLSPDYICDLCTKETALHCPHCDNFTCIHLSLWGDDDERGPNNEQIVHRCNDCESELETPGSERDKKLLEDFRIEIQQATLGTASLSGAKEDEG